MAGYSKEQERQNKVLGDLLSGREPEKRIFVGYEGQKETKGKESDLTKIMKDVRMPLFCPECKKVMKRRLDDKMYRLHNHCFDCQVKFENKLRIEGKYEEWEEKKVLNNQLSYIKDQIGSIEDWKEEASKPVEVFDSVGIKEVELQKEKWSQNKEQVETMSKEALEELNKMKTEVEEKLNSLEV